jgi:microcystin degradation protein MlrC
MKRVLLAAFKQETSTFNPALTRYDHFHIHRGAELIEAYAGTGSEIAGALDAFAAAGNIEVVPTLAANSVSGGPVDSADLDRISADLLEHIRANARVDGAYIVFHGAMHGVDEMDPEGRILAGARTLLGDIPIVTSFDLHGIITDRLVAQADSLVAFHTYPHTDQYSTGQRAASNLLTLLNGQARPTIARIKLPMLVRGDELLTATGKFGEAIRRCQAIEASEGGLAASVFIGNPFTDVPDLQSNIIVVTDNDPERARHEAETLAHFMWDQRQAFVAPLKSLTEAITIAQNTQGLTVFSDAADATASGAPGDSNAIIKALRNHPFNGTALIPLVDSAAVDHAFKAGVGSELTLPLGGSLDPKRHTPLELTVYVKALSDGNFTYEDGTAEHAGRTAVLLAENLHLLVTEKPIYIVGRRVFQAHGLEPQDYDVVVAKSPNGFRTYYQEIAAAIVPVDAPGATSANLRSLPYSRCVRPTFPLDADVEPTFEVHLKE